MKILESKNAKYKEQLHRAKKKISKSRQSSQDLKRTTSKNSLNEEFMSNTSFMSIKQQNSTRRAPRKSLMLFMDVRNKLNQICSENQEMSKNVVSIVGELERKESRRLSTLSNRFPDFNEIKDKIKVLKLKEKQ